MRKGLYVSLTLLLFVSTVIAAEVEKTDRCTPLKNTFDDIYKRAGAKKASNEYYIPPSELSSLLKAFDEIPAFTKTESDEIQKQIDEATTFHTYFSADIKRIELTCLGPAVSAMGAIINGVKAKVYSPGQVQKIQKFFETRIKSEINSAPIGLVVHSVTVNRICSDGLDKQFKVKCDGIQKFTEETHAANKALTHVFQFETAPYKFGGRFIYYWEKYVNKKDYKENITDADIDTFDRIFDYGALAGTYRKYSQEFKSRREEFEKRFFL